ncbi:MAG: hypothetical protein ACMUJM_20490 [bacterium]
MVEPLVTQTAPPQTRTSAINAPGSSVSRLRYVNGVYDSSRRERIKRQHTFEFFPCH